MTSTSVLDVALSNNGVGLLTITGPATLGGTLNPVSTSTSFDPPLGTGFKFLNAPSLSGAFAVFNPLFLPPLNELGLDNHNNLCPATPKTAG